MTIMLIGCGKMGGAMLEGWLDQGVPKDAIRVIEAHEAHAQFLRDTYDVPVYATIPEVEKGFPAELIVLAVKPQMMDAALADLDFYTHKSTFISIAAGKPLAYFEQHLGADSAIIRVMPNTPSAVRRGMSVACANTHVTDAAKTLTDDLLKAIGEVAWIDDEKDMDAVTAVSGSGPAYVFHLCEVLSSAGQKAGLSKALADQLAEATISGAGELIRQSNQSPTQLRKNVTSPNGTTQAALDVLMQDSALETLLSEAVDAAAKRSQELAR